MLELRWESPAPPNTLLRRSLPEETAHFPGSNGPSPLFLDCAFCSVFLQIGLLASWFFLLRRSRADARWNSLRFQHGLVSRGDRDVVQAAR